MTQANRLPVFEKFIHDARAAWAELPDDESRMKRIKLLLEKFVNEPSVREHSKNWPSTDGHKNLLLYEDPDYGFAINAVVRVQDAQGRAHDHAHSWTAYGVLDGQEKMERFRCVEDRRKEGYVKIELQSISESGGGTVDLVPPFEVHGE